MHPWEKVSTGAYMPDTSDHVIIQGGDDVLHPLNSVVLVPGYNTPDKLTTFAWWYKDPYIPQMDACKASHSNIWFNPMTLGKTRTTAWKDCWRQERLKLGLTVTSSKRVWEWVDAGIRLLPTLPLSTRHRNVLESLKSSSKRVWDWVDAGTGFCLPCHCQHVI